MICQECIKKCCDFILIEYTGFSDDWKRWINLHNGVSAFEIKGRKFLKIESRCLMLTPKGKCAIYRHRPQMCKDFNCESPEFQHTKRFL